MEPIKQNTPDIGEWVDAFVKELDAIRLPFNKGFADLLERYRAKGVVQGMMRNDEVEVTMDVGRIKGLIEEADIISTSSMGYHTKQ